MANISKKEAKRLGINQTMIKKNTTKPVDITDKEFVNMQCERISDARRHFMFRSECRWNEEDRLCLGELENAVYELFKRFHDKI